MPGETILVVDDAVFIVKLIAKVLQNSGYKVQLASTAEEALSSLNTLQPDLVLVDIQLPGMGGLGSEQEEIDAGCKGFSAKPVEPKALAAQIHRFLEGETEEPAGQ